MTWKEKMKEFGGGDFTFISQDGESLIFIVVGEPVLMEGEYKKQKSERIGCPVVTDEGYMLFVTGKRTARKISKYEDSFKSNALMVTRHGEEGDTNATYSVTLLPEKETFKHLDDIRKKDFKPDMIPDSVEQALEVMKN